MRCGLSIAVDNTTAIEDGCTSDAPMDKASFLALYEETAPRLLAYIRRACGDAALADDILQETFCKLLRMPLPQLEQHQLKAYVYRTATSLLTDHWRRAQRERRWSFLTRFEEQAPPTHDLSPDVQQLFRTLKPQQQALLWLAYVEGFDHLEIAATLQLGERSVRVLLFRARKRLARILFQHGLGPQEPL